MFLRLLPLALPAMIFRNGRVAHPTFPGFSLDPVPKEIEGVIAVLQSPG